MALFNNNKKTMADVLICDKCNDVGYLIGYKQSLSSPTVQEQWTEVCPYCMPTTKYGNIQEKLRLAAESNIIQQHLLPRLPDNPEEDN